MNPHLTGRAVLFMSLSSSMVRIPRFHRGNGGFKSPQAYITHKKREIFSMTKLINILIGITLIITVNVTIDDNYYLISKDQLNTMLTALNVAYGLPVSQNVVVRVKGEE